MKTLKRISLSCALLIAVSSSLSVFGCAFGASSGAFAAEESFQLQSLPDRVEHSRSEDGVINDCEWFTLKKPYAVCITRQEGSRSNDILWYMHGASGNEKKWVNHFGPIRDAWKKMGYEVPTTVTLSFGPVWLMAEKNGKSTSGLWEFITETLMPLYESRIFGDRGPGRRIVMGESMGGFNTAQMAMKRPELFDRAAILCPAITTFGPYSRLKTLNAFLKEHHEASWFAVYWEAIMEKVFYPDEKTWDETGSALSIGPKYLGPHTPPLYLSCGEQDEFGFHVGAQAFAEMARAQGVSVTWESLQGEHCVYDAEAVARFLAGH